MMLRPGWVARYAPPQVIDLMPRGFVVFWGYLWAFCWFTLAVSNIVVERLYGLKAWAIWTNFAPIVLAAALIGAGMVVFPPIVRRAARERGISFTKRPAGA